MNIFKSICFENLGIYIYLFLDSRKHGFVILVQSKGWYGVFRIEEKSSMCHSKEIDLWLKNFLFLHRES